MKIVLTQTEIKQMVAQSLYLDVSDIDLEIVLEQSEVPETRTEGQTNEEWWAVPSNWDNAYCPLRECLLEIEIEVEQRNGSRMVGTTAEFVLLWRQDGFPEDIVRYRIANVK